MLERRCSDSGPTFVHGSSGGNGGRGRLFWQWKIHNFASLVQVTFSLKVSLKDGWRSVGTGFYRSSIGLSVVVAVAVAIVVV